jgi:hypothetical protein
LVNKYGGELLFEIYEFLLDLSLKFVDIEIDHVTKKHKVFEIDAQTLLGDQQKEICVCDGPNKTGLDLLMC